MLGTWQVPRHDNLTCGGWVSRVRAVGVLSGRSVSAEVSPASSLDSSASVAAAAGAAAPAGVRPLLGRSTEEEEAGAEAVGASPSPSPSWSLRCEAVADSVVLSSCVEMTPNGSGEAKTWASGNVFFAPQLENCHVVFGTVQPANTKNCPVLVSSGGFSRGDDGCHNVTGDFGGFFPEHSGGEPSPDRLATTRDPEIP